MQRIAFNLYLLFMVSWFLHLGSRIPFLGMLRLDLLLMLVLYVLMFVAQRSEQRTPVTSTDKWLRVMIVYAIVTIPFVQWPGSVVRFGIPELIKAVSFYYFTVAFVRSEAELKKFLFVFLTCQVWRILEPLLLHVTIGYWGSSASELGGAEVLNRLQGAPHDSINPNGLAFIVCMVMPFLYFFSDTGWRQRIAFLLVAPLGIYTLTLTGSRSGLVALAIVFIGIALKSKRPKLMIISGVLAGMVGFTFLSADMQDRYLSVVGLGHKNTATAEGRITGISTDIDVILRRPLLGYGLGTSAEANFNFSGRPQPAHNIYTETGEELGLIGLFFFVMFLRSIFFGFVELRRTLRDKQLSPVLQKTVDAVQVWVAMDFIFSFASYGLLSFDWYMLSGMLITLKRLAHPDGIPETLKRAVKIRRGIPR